MTAPGELEATLERARALDAKDPLASYRSRFALPYDTRGAPLLYLCGHSLGLQPLAARTLVNEELEDWARLGVLGHEHARRPWIPYHENFTRGLESLTGASASEVVAMNSLTVNLHLMLAAFYQPNGRRTKLLIEAGAFSSDRHAVASQIAWHGLDPAQTLIELEPPVGEDLITHEALEACIEKHGDELALVLWPGVQFRTGQAFDLERIVQAARRAGCAVGFDLAHAIGNLPLHLHDSQADFAVWCSYKYLNAGPGAIGGCFVHERHSASANVKRLTGWWGHDLASRFEMKPQFVAALGAHGWQISNPPVLAAAPLLASLELFRAAGIVNLREKSVRLTGFLECMVKQLAPEVRIITPSQGEARGCQLSLRIPTVGTSGADRGRRVFERLGALGVICDWRDPDVIRVAPVPFYNSFEDVFRFADLLATALREVDQ